MIILLLTLNLKLFMRYFIVHYEWKYLKGQQPNPFDHFNSLVNDLIVKGWKPIGGICFYDFSLSQAMIQE